MAPAETNVVVQYPLTLADLRESQPHSPAGNRGSTNLAKPRAAPPAIRSAYFSIPHTVTSTMEFCSTLHV